MNKESITRYLRLLGFGILFILLARIDIPALGKVLVSANPIWISVALLLNFLALVLKVSRWRLLVTMQSARYGLVKSVLAYLGSIFLGIVTPGRLGEFARALYLKQDGVLSVGRGVSTVFVDRLCDLYLLVAVGLLGIWGSPSHRLDAALPWFIAFGAALLVVPLIILNRSWWVLLSGFLSKLVSKRFLDRLGGSLDEFQTGLVRSFRPNLVVAIALTVASFLVGTWQCVLLASALGISLPPWYLAFVLAIVGLVGMIPVSVAGVGTREAAMVILLSPRGVNAEVAIAFSALFFLVFYIGIGAFGALAWWIKPIRMGGNESL